MAVRRILIRRDTTENWNSPGATLLSNGELGVEICTDGTRKLKIGDGFSAWPGLPYAIDNELYANILNVIDEKDAEQEKKINEIEEALAGVSGSVSEISEDVAEANAVIAEISEKNEEQDSKLESLEDQGVSHDSVIAELTGRIGALEDTPVSDEILDSIEEKNTEQDRRLEAIEDDNYSINQKLATVENVNGIQSGLLSTLASSLQTLQDDVLSVETSQGIYDTKFQWLDFKTAEHEDRLNDIESSRQDDEIANLDNLLSNLSDALAAETAARTSTDSSHAVSIGNLYDKATREQINRIDADNGLQSNIDTLTSNLTDAINQEKEYRETNDDTLQSNIDTLSDNLTDAINQEKEYRESSDSMLQGAIDLANSDLATEILNRVAADTSLQSQVSTNLSGFQDLEANVGNPHSVTKAQVGLGNVDDTSDEDKPVSTAQQSAITAAIATANGYTDGRIEAVVNGTLHYKGDVATYDALPTDNGVFDLWHVLDTKKGYYWFGEEWNLLDFSVDLSSYYEKQETDTLLGGKVDKEEGKGLSSNDFTDSYIQTIQALSGNLRVFHDELVCTSDVYEDILVTRYMLKSDLSVTNSSMSVVIDGLLFRAVATSSSNLRTEVSSVEGTVRATVRRNSFYDSDVEGQTAQNVDFTTTPRIIDSTIFINSNDYSIYQVFVGSHWWEINLWAANAKSAVLMSVERRL
jgi:hypothetical protein